MQGLIIERDGEKFIWSSVEDITERKRAEEAIRESEERFRTLADTTSTAIFVYQGEKFVYCNKSSRDISGYSEEEFLTTNFWSFVHPDFHELIKQRGFSRQRGEKIISNYEFKIICKDGTEKWLDFTAGVINWNGIVASIGTAYDITERKAAGEQLRRWEKIFQHSGWGVTIADPFDDTLLAVNPACAMMYGYTQDEVIGKKLSDFFAPETKAELPKHIEIVHREGKHSYESVHIRKDGSRFPVLITVTAFKDEKGNLLYRAANIVDITERKHAETALHEKEHLLSESQRIAQIGGWAWDFSGPIKWTDETYRIYGVSPKTFTPTIETLVNLIHPEDRSAMQHWLEDCTAGKSPGELVFRTILPDGSIHFLSGRGELIYDSENKPILMSGTVQDITERKRVSEELRKSEERLRLSTELANVAVWEYDFISNSMSRSSNHDQLYELEWQEKWDINTFLNATHPDDREYSNSIIQKSVAVGGPDNYKFDFRVVYPDQSIHWLNVTGQVVERNTEGQGIIVRGTLIPLCLY